jgi:predicted phage-related endonuclease
MRELPGSQQGDLWTEHKIGRISASRMKDLMAYNQPTAAQKKEGITQGKESAARRNYRFELLSERITKRRKNHYVTPAMEWGIEAEEEAKRAYELATGEMLMPIGFVLHPVYDWAGASPDALLPQAVYEAKNPESTTFLEWYFSDTVPEDHYDQIQWQIRCCDNREHGIFHARDSRQPESIRNLIRMVDKDSARIAELEAEAIKMNDEVEAMISKLGLPPTVWDVTGNPVVHYVASEAEAMADLNEMLNRSIALEGF